MNDGTIGLAPYNNQIGDDHTPGCSYVDYLFRNSLISNKIVSWSTKIGKNATHSASTVTFGDD